MRWGEKRYNSLNYELRSEFGEKIFKVSLDGGFTCPNRDGTISHKGCIFCNDSGSGDFAGDRRKTITDQIDEQIEFLGKGRDKKYIAYFQNFTNTYGDIEYLRKIYEEAMEHPGIVGLAISTRADCLPDEVVELLKELNKKTFLWIEIGLQSIHDKSAEVINRGYAFDVFDSNIPKLAEAGIRVVVHVIVGLPRETKEETLETIKYLSSIDVWGVKIHLLHIIKDTELQRYYLEKPFKLYEKDEYIEFVVELIEHLNPNIVIHRLTGDGTWATLFAPMWSTDKRGVLNGINSLLKKKDTCQGRKYVQGQK